MQKAQKPTVKAKVAAPVKKTGSQARTAPAKSAVKAVAPAKRVSAPAKAPAPAKPAAKTAKSAAPAKSPAKAAKAVPVKSVATAKSPAKAAKAVPVKSVATAKSVSTAKSVAPAAKSAPAKATPPRRSPQLDKFLLEQRVMLEAERAIYLEKAAELKAEADSLALEHEPGDIQFDEEGGEGGTTNVDRELDLALSAQARAAVDEIDRSITKIAAGTYGLCEQCGKEIPRPRLKVLPYASLCVQCKSGGLSRR